MTKILLINPSIRGSLYATPCLGLAYVGAALQKAGHDVTLCDGSLSLIDADAVVRLVAEAGPDCVGITGFTLQYQVAREIFPAVKRSNPDIITVFGGQHASALTEYVMNDVPDIDFGIRGEGEIAFPALLEAFTSGNEDFKQIAGLAYRENGGVTLNPTSPITDLDGLEYPWRVVNPLDYAGGMTHGFMAKRRPVAPVVSSRGCPYKCTFCAGSLVLGRQLRLRDPAKFVDEIEYLIDNFGIREIQIVDDNFTFHQEHATRVCEEILRRRLDIVWSLPNGIRADRVDNSLLKLMKQAGCYYLAFGIEFGSERMLKITNKQLSLQKTRETIDQAAKLGYITHGFFMMGHPQEKKEDILATIAMARQTSLDRFSATFIVPLPGSEVFQYYLDKGYLNLNDVNWEQFAGPQFIPQTEFVTFQELIGLLRSAYTKFYANPFRVLRYLSKLRSSSQIQGLWPGVKTLFTSMVHRGKWWKDSRTTTATSSPHG